MVIWFIGFMFTMGLIFEEEEFFDHSVTWYQWVVWALVTAVFWPMMLASYVTDIVKGDK